MTAHLLVLSALLVGLILPGWLLIGGVRGRLWSWDSLGLGAAVAVALATTLSYVFPGASWQLVALFYLLALVGLARGRPALLPAQRPGVEWLVLGWVAVCEWMVLASSWWPDGWDTAFHSILAEKILLSGQLSVDWMPIDNIPMHYPQGLHAITAWLSRLSGQGVPLVLQVLHFPYQMGATLALYRLGRDLYQDRRAALGAVVLYAFCGFWGTFINYIGWGGLPTEVGCWLYLEILWLALRPSRPGWLVSGLLMGAIGLCHHLTSILVAVLVIGQSLALVWRKPEGWRAQLSFWWCAVGVAVVAFSFYWVPYLSHARQLTSGGSSALTYGGEAAVTNPFTMMGWVISLVGLAGLCLREPKNRGTLAVRSWFWAMLIGWIGLDFVYRGAGYLWTGRDFAALTPSRWLTIEAYPLALLGGYALSRLGSRVFTGFCLVAMSIGFYRHWELARPIVFPPEQLALCKKLREIPNRTLIAFSQPPPKAQWLAYLTWHPTLTSPIPSSEDRRPLLHRLELFKNFNEHTGEVLAREGLDYVVVAPDGSLIK